MKTRDKQIAIVVGILALAAVLANYHFMFSVLSGGCKDMTPYMTMSADLNTITFNSPGYYYSCPAGVPDSLCGGTCIALPLDLANHDIASISVNLAGNFYTNTGGEACSNNVPNPVYTSANQSGLNVYSDGVTMDLAFTSGGKYYRGAGSFCGTSQYTAAGTIVLRDKQTQPYCGDRICQATESKSTCPADCGTVQPPPDSSASFMLIGILAAMAAGLAYAYRRVKK